MSTVTCPNGHESNDPEWCDTCGAKIAGAPAADPAAPAPASPPMPGEPLSPAAPSSEPPAGAVIAGGVPCPHCGTPNPPDNLFCEQCGYDFTTGQAPPDDTQAPPAEAPDVELGTTRWVVIVEIDPAWFALKGELSDQECPAASTSTVPVTGHTTLVGRTSQSRGVRPEIALDNDTGVSRRHAQFVREADVVSVVDLSSTNGTYVVVAGTSADEDTPPLTPGVPVVLGDGDQVYLGAWSRLTLRSA